MEHKIKHKTTEKISHYLEYPETHIVFESISNRVTQRTSQDVFIIQYFCVTSSILNTNTLSQELRACLSVLDEKLIVVLLNSCVHVFLPPPPPPTR